MSKRIMKGSCMLGPLPAALVSCAAPDGRDNLLTIAWTGIVNSHPPMCYISVRPERYSYEMIKESGEFAINLTTKDMARATDYCGVRSGRDEDKWAACDLHREPASEIAAPLISESPLSLECKVRDVIPLGSHDMFLAEILAVDAGEEYFDEKGYFDLNRAGLISYIHGSYVENQDTIGTFGWSVKKKKKKKR